AATLPPAAGGRRPVRRGCRGSVQQVLPLASWEQRQGLRHGEPTPAQAPMREVAAAMSFFNQHAPNYREHNRALPDLSQHEGELKKALPQVGFYSLATDDPILTDP